HGYTPVVIATVSEIANAEVDPDVVVTITGDTFEVGIAEADLEIDVGATTLVFASVTRDSPTQITIAFTTAGAQEGTPVGSTWWRIDDS
ncbi:unnamed protein product, partial [marine sediment metagenome]